MRTVHRYPVPPTTCEHFALKLPMGAIVRRVEARPCGVCLWIEHETKNDVEECRFMIVATGREIPEGVGPYLGTAFRDEIVWHVFADHRRRGQ